MSINVRRVVTGHDDQGRAKVLIDETVKNVASQRPGALYSVIWSSEGFPVNNDGDADPSGKKIGTTISDGTVFRIVSFGPGVAPRNHRTDSIDYAVVMSGEIDMELESEKCTSRPGHVLVQRGTIHNWVNTGSEPCVIAFTLVSAKSVTAGREDAACPGLSSSPIQLWIVPEDSHLIEGDPPRRREVGLDARPHRNLVTNRDKT